MLKNLYNDINYQLKKQNEHPEGKNSLNIFNSTVKQHKSIGLQEKTPSKLLRASQEPPDYTRKNMMRNNSTPSGKVIDYLNYASHLAMSQKKYTRSKPKIIFTNPITGIPPVF